MADGRSQTTITIVGIIVVILPVITMVVIDMDAITTGDTGIDIVTGIAINDAGCERALFVVNVRLHVLDLLVLQV